MNDDEFRDRLIIAIAPIVVEQTYSGYDGTVRYGEAVRQTYTMVDLIMKSRTDTKE